MKSFKAFKFHFFICVSLHFFSSSWAQENSMKDSLEKGYNTYYKPLQEVVYAHLNKSKFAENETLGFTAYVLHKQEKKLSLQTKNLYCIISSSSGKSITKQLIEVTNGIGNGSVKIDSSFVPGKYQLTLFTNWMLNFKAPNHFTTSFEVLEKDAKKLFKKRKRSDYLDIQILPESGHFLENKINTAGIIVKDSLGFGVQNLKGKIITENGKLISDFKLNSLGIGRFSIVPLQEEKYKIIVDNFGKKVTLDFVPEVYNKGFIIKVATTKLYCNVSIVTNKESLEINKNNKFKLAISDGKKLKSIPLNFKEQNTINIKFKLTDLGTGINVFTLFKNNRIPIAERLFFNYHNLKIHKSKVKKVVKKDTTINYILNYSNIKNDSLNNVSISILPALTKAYKKNSNIIAQTLIQPYISGKIENGGYYFNNINAKKKYDLDNLLLTQGWSSYDWNSILIGKPNNNYPFEKGISLKITTNNNKYKSFVLHSTSNSSTQFINLKASERAIIISDFYPKNEKFVKFSRRNKKGNLYKVDLALEFYPNKVPEFKRENTPLYNKPNYFASERIYDINLFKRLNDVEILEEIIIDAKLTKKKKLQSEASSFGRVLEVDNFDRNQTLANFINKQPNYSAFDNPLLTELEVKHRSGTTPAIVLNDFWVTEDRMFYFWLDTVDFVVIDQQGWAANFRGSANGVKIYQGVIKVYTNPKKYANTKSNRLTKYSLPLSFSKAKKFYRPKYSNYTDDFFKEYGVIDWFPINKIDTSGNLNLKFWNGQKNTIKLFIEGITQDGAFILEEKIIRLD